MSKDQKPCSAETDHQARQAFLSEAGEHGHVLLLAAHHGVLTSAVVRRLDALDVEVRRFAKRTKAYWKPVEFPKAPMPELPSATPWVEADAVLQVLFDAGAAWNGFVGAVENMLAAHSAALNCVRIDPSFLHETLARRKPAPFLMAGFAIAAARSLRVPMPDDDQLIRLEVALHICKGVDDASPDLKKRRERWRKAAPIVLRLAGKLLAPARRRDQRK